MDPVKMPAIFGEDYFSFQPRERKKEFSPHNSKYLYRYEKIDVTRKHMNIEGNGK